MNAISAFDLLRDSEWWEVEPAFVCKTVVIGWHRKWTWGIKAVRASKRQI